MIIPYPSEAVEPPTQPILRKRITRWRRKITRALSALTLSNRGSRYSIERMLSLKEYGQRTSTLRALLVCLATPLPATVALLALELFPIQDPMAGWLENYGFWIRAFVVAAAVGNNLLVHARYMISGCVISPQQMIVLVLWASLLETVVIVAVAACICFPIPFTLITMSPPYYLILTALFTLVVGRRVVQEMLLTLTELLQYIKLMSAQEMMAIVYPAYQVLFLRVSRTNYELPVLLLLPVIKLVMKNTLLRCLALQDDSIPQDVIFSVDLFNAIYSATSIESASSSSTIVLAVSLNALRSASKLYRFHRQTANILANVRAVTSSPDDSERHDLLGELHHLSKLAQLFCSQNRRNIRIHSCFPHTLSQESCTLLNKLQASTLAAASLPTSSNSRRVKTGTTGAQRVSPDIFDSLPSVRFNSSTATNGDDGINAEDILSKSLEMLFTAECHVLGAYLNAVIPLLYSHYMLIMVNLPSAKYHTEMAGITSNNVTHRVDALFIFCLVEVVSLMLLSAILSRNLGLRAVHHLAFVLETHTEQVQGKLLAWLFITMAFRVVHFGVDFTFRFSWLRNK